jgi:hypothetical protein
MVRFSPPTLVFEDEPDYDFEKVMKHNVVFVGSSYNNKSTGKLLDILQECKAIPPTSFVESSGNALRVATPEGKTHQFAVSERVPDSFADYALVLKDDNPLAPGKKVFVLAGCSTLGTGMASLVMSSIVTLDALYQRFGSEAFRIVVETKIRNLRGDPNDDPVRIVFPEDEKLNAAVLPRSKSSVRAYVTRYPIVSSLFLPTVAFLVLSFAAGMYAAWYPSLLIPCALGLAALGCIANNEMEKRRIPWLIHPGLCRIARDALFALFATSLVALAASSIFRN